MFIDTPFQITRHADIKNGVVFVGDDVDVIHWLKKAGIVRGPSTPLRSAQDDMHLKKD
jgi:hypothetical protein